ncbi:NmrA domain-containing protein [Mycena venus]|uniref:NmrA domain-containing protein n=1 Tax=Mycena venus TaxID=2733690 RepID=A0A8H6Z157_9AGAR|nr:NmrA domain-containing protein [Mycena venus]
MDFIFVVRVNDEKAEEGGSRYGSTGRIPISAYKFFAVVGAGTVDLPIVNALAAAKGASVILLSRPGSSHKTVPPNVQTITVDFNDAAATTVLKEHKVDVVFSTLTTTAAAAQTPLVDAAKLAAVKLFVPSEYRLPTEGATEGPIAAKNEIASENI